MMFGFKRGHHDGHPIVASLNAILSKGKQAMATMQQVLDDLNAFAQEVTDYVASRDAIDTDLKAQLAAAIAAAGGAATQDQVDAAFAAAEAAKASLTPPAPPAPAAP